MVLPLITHNFMRKNIHVTPTGLPLIQPRKTAWHHQVFQKKICQPWAPELKWDLDLCREISRSGQFQRMPIIFMHETDKPS